MKINKILGLALVSVSMLAFTGCKAPQDVAYFQNAESIMNVANVQPIKIKPEDKLQIIVKSKDPAVSDLFNMPVYSQRVGTGSLSSNDGVVSRTYRPVASDGVAPYTVDPQGCIDFPVLGKLKVAGMTRSELSGFIKGELIGRNLVKDPIVAVDYLNTGVNLMGQVARPGRYEINSDHLTLLEALSMAGDLSLMGRRDNVKVLREENGDVHVYTVDLTNLKGLSSSPVYYLQQNDIVYVEPNDMAKRQTKVNGNNVLSTSFWISVASLITTAVTTVGVFINK